MLLLRGTLVPALLLVPAPVTVAARLIAPGVAIAALLVIAPAVAAPATAAAFCAALVVPVARLVARPVLALRPFAAHRRLVGCGGLLGGLVGLEPAEQPAEESRARGFRCRAARCCPPSNRC